MDVDLSASQGVNDVRVHIHAENFDAVRREGGCGGQADIAQTQNTYFFEVQWSLLVPRPTSPINE
jgi:hypothetical protein